MERSTAMGRSLKKWFIVSLCVSLCIISIACTSNTSQKQTDDLKVGVLLDTNGQTYSVGKSSLIAIQMTVNDINQYLKDLGHTKQVKLFVEDTKGDPKIAAEKIKNFKKEGIVPVICGSSEEIEAVSDYAKQNQQLLISGISTAPSLAEKDSNLFRFCTNDIQQGQAIVRFALESGIKNIVLVYRDDVYGKDLRNSIVQYGKQMNINIDQETKYNPENKDFGNTIASIEQQVKQKKSESSSDKVAVVLISFDEVNEILKAAAGKAELESVRWIGCDGVPAEVTVFKDDSALKFAQKTDFTVCNLGISGRVDVDFLSRLKQKIGTDNIQATDLYYCDAMWVIAQSWLNISKVDYELFKKNIPVTANWMRGYTGGDLGLDENGDRKWGRYGFWSIKDNKFEKSANIVFGHFAPKGEYTKVTSNQ